MFSVNNEGVIEIEDDLRFNFPELPAPAASSPATCTGQFDKPLCPRYILIRLIFQKSLQSLDFHL